MEAGRQVLVVGGGAEVVEGEDRDRDLFLDGVRLRTGIGSIRKEPPTPEECQADGRCDRQGRGDRAPDFPGACRGSLLDSRLQGRFELRGRGLLGDGWWILPLGINGDDRCDDAVAALGDGLDVTRIPRVVTQRLTQLADAAMTGALFDRDIGPQLVEEFTCRNDSWGVLDQVHQDIHGGGLETQLTLVREQHVEVRDDFEIPESIAPRRRLGRLGAHAGNPGDEESARCGDKGGRSGCTGKHPISPSTPLERDQLQLRLEAAVSSWVRWGVAFAV